MKPKLLMLIAAIAVAISARAQTTPTHVTGTFKTPANQTPAQAGLKQIATVAGSTAVYGSVDFEPWDMGANRPTALLCGQVTYPPQKVHVWVKGDATMIDDAAAAGKDLIPNAGCLPTGAVYRATIYFAPSNDGRVPAITIFQFKTIPAQASVDWGALALAALSSTAYSYQPQSAAVILDYEDHTAIAAPANPAAGFGRTWFDAAALKFKCKTSTAADCNPAGAGGGSQHQVNAVNILANDPINFQDNLAIVFTNPSLGNVRAGLRVAAGCTTSANGDLCFDSTNNRWKAWQTADRFLIASTNVGASGQVALSNADGSATFADPLVTYNQVLLLNAVAATATQTSAAVTLATRMTVGSLNVVGSGITGAPAGCTIAYRLSLGGVNTADIQSFAFTPGNNYQNFQTTPGGANAAADQMVAAYTCTTFPTAGTLTVSFSPVRSASLRDALPAGTSTIGGVNLAQYTPVAGRLPVDGSGVTQPVSAASLPLPGGAAQEHTTAASPHGVRLTDGTAFYKATTPADTQPVSLASITPVTATGTITALNAAVAISVGGYGAVGIQLSGTWTATALFEATVDGTNWQAIEAWPTNSATSATSSTANGVWHIPTGGLNQIRVRGNPFTSGTITVDLRATTAAAKMLAAGGTGGTSSSFGAAFPGTGTAVGVKATAAAPAHAEGNMVGLSVDLGGLARVRCDAGCAAAGDTVGTSVSLAALNNTASVALAGENGSAVIFTAAVSPVFTIVAEVSPDGGTTWFSAVFLDPVSGATSTSLVNPANGQWQIGYVGAQSNARVRVSAFTSGSITAQLRSTVTRPFVFAYGSDGTNIRAVRTAGDGTLRVDPTGTTTQPVSAASLPLPAGAAQEHATAASPHAARLTDGTAFYKATTPADTQPVSLAAAIDVSDRAARLLGQVEGRAASGAAKAGNPNQVGCIFNTTPSTVTTGQAVELGCTNRGELFIAKGPTGFSIDNTGFNVTGSLPAGTNNIGGINVAQINGVAPLMGNGVTGTGSSRVTLASDNSNSPGIGGSATGAAPPSGAHYMAGNASGATGGLLAGVILCDSSVVISTATSGSTQLVALTASQTIYVCSYNWMANGAVNVKLLYGTGTACATGPVDLTGAYNHTAQTGIAVTSPSWTGIKTASANAVCINLSAAVQVSGVLMYAKF